MRKNGAPGGIRTRNAATQPAPKAGPYTNSGTSAKKGRHCAAQIQTLLRGFSSTMTGNDFPSAIANTSVFHNVYKFPCFCHMAPPFQITEGPNLAFSAYL